MNILIRLTRYALRYRRQLAFTYLCLVGATLLTLIIPRLLGMAIDFALSTDQQGRLFLLSILVLCVSLAQGLFAYGQAYLTEIVSQKVAYDIRNAFFDHLQHLNFSFHDRQLTGDLMSKATVDVEALRWFVSVGLIRSVNLVILSVSVTAILVIMEWRLAALTLWAVPVVAIITTRVSRNLRQIWKRVQEETGIMTTVLQENLAGIRVVKALGGEDYETSKFQIPAKAVSEETFTATRLHSSNSALIALIFAGAIGIVLWFGGRWTLDGSLSPGQLAQFIFYLGLLAFPIRMTGWVVNVFSRAISAGERIFTVIDSTSIIQEKPGAISISSIKGHIAFQDVCFTYDNHVAAIENVTFNALPGQKIALLGAPGSGKSTIVQLIPRFYDITSGKITIDGTDIRDMTLHSLRRSVSIVFQDIFLFAATVRDNIAYGLPEASLKEIEYAARSAQIHEFIANLPNGYETWVGERGVTLSGGQRQRIAIARTLLLNPSILILDDSTSSVDAGTELQLQEAMLEVMKNRTTFIIAHRLTSIRQADSIMVFDSGHLVQKGTHRELLVGSSPYRRIHDLQILPNESLKRDDSGDIK